MDGMAWKFGDGNGSFRQGAEVGILPFVHPGGLRIHRRTGCHGLNAAHKALQLGVHPSDGQGPGDADATPRTSGYH